VKLEWLETKTLRITPPPKLNLDNINTEVANKIRVSLYLLPALVHNQKKGVLPQPGGCRMGSRSIIAHQLALESYGIKFHNNPKGIEFTVPQKFKPGQTVMYEMSDTATVNAVLTAALIPAEHKIEFASANYMVQEALFFLEHLGVKINGIGTSSLEVVGSSKINKNVEYHLTEDPIESMMFIAAAIVTNSTLTITRCPIDFLKLELLKLKTMGQKMRLGKAYKSWNGKTNLVDITLLPSKLKALEDKIHAQTYPGINSDNLPFFVPIACKATGSTLIHDWMWENRAIYFTELNKLGAKINLLDPHRVTVEGPVSFKPAQIVSPPALRPAVIILISMLAAPGVSILRNIYSIKRGYEEIAERLNSIGAQIEILTS
jgi:UDP-N-acetylglucosamine 1-carboxyvinyltransferase